MTLKDIYEIHTGLFARPEKLGDVTYLQARHFDEEGNLVCELEKDLSTSEINPKHILNQGDLLYAAKGNKNFAFLYTEGLVPAVASTSFFVLRPKVNQSIKKVVPEYMLWYLNQPKTMDYLKSMAKGTSMLSISKQTLADLEVEIPVESIQEKIGAINALRKQEKKIIHQLEVLKDQFIQSRLLKVIK
ncbi:restriction endonuclease subunit S [Echinicola strongylocentroti]|uniref:restriction endonuclease subunit S n=1 Tax=Echinicola strongylocentroti TaxID=1795355 RepID=UPI0013A6B7FC|nr:restriction endonuclease subunit S [Echinicola strongylocentroti]